MSSDKVKIVLTGYTVRTIDSNLSVDGLRIRDGVVQLHFVGDMKWYTQRMDRHLKIIKGGGQ